MGSLELPQLCPSQLFLSNGKLNRSVLKIYSFKHKDVLYEMNRYLVISQPLNLRDKPTSCWAYSMSLSAWLYSAIFASLPLFGVTKYVPEGFLTGCSYDYLSDDPATGIFILIFFIGAWVIPMIIIIYSYVAIFRAVVHVRRDVTMIPNSAADAGNQIITRRTTPIDNIHNNTIGN